MKAQEKRLAKTIASGRAPVPMNDPEVLTYKLGVFSMLLGREREALDWFAQGASHGSIFNAILSRDPNALEAPLAAGPGTLAVSRFVHHLLAGNESAAGEAANECGPMAKMALTLLDRDPVGFGTGLNEYLTSHKKFCAGNRHHFNSPTGFMSQYGSAFSALAADRGMPVHVDPKFTKAKLQFLFIMLKDIEDPPSHIVVDLVPEIYRTPRPGSGS